MGRFDKGFNEVWDRSAKHARITSEEFSAAVSAAQAEANDYIDLARRVARDLSACGARPDTHVGPVRVEAANDDAIVALDGPPRPAWSVPEGPFRIGVDGSLWWVVETSCTKRRRPTGLQGPSADVVRFHAGSVQFTEPVDLRRAVSRLSIKGDSFTGSDYQTLARGSGTLRVTFTASRGGKRVTPVFLLQRNHRHLPNPRSILDWTAYTRFEYVHNDTLRREADGAARNGFYVVYEEDNFNSLRVPMRQFLPQIPRSPGHARKG